MKRWLSLLLVTLLLLGLVSCGVTSDSGKVPGEGDPTNGGSNEGEDNKGQSGDMNNGNTGNNGNNNDQSQGGQGADSLSLTYQSAHELLAGLWAARGEEDRFPIMGGDYDNVVENAPGAFDLAHPDASANIDSLLSFPSDEITKIDSAASIIHSMNANIFTCGAFHVSNAEDVVPVSERIKNHIMTKQFICGSPERLIILRLPGDYLMVLYGTSDAVVGFAEQTKTLVKDASTLVDQTLTS
jgi:hypothetical protein